MCVSTFHDWIMIFCYCHQKSSLMRKGKIIDANILSTNEYKLLQKQKYIKFLQKKTRSNLEQISSKKGDEKIYNIF